MFSNNNKTSYTPITVGSINMSGMLKNNSPKINYFTPTPPASPTYKDNIVNEEKVKTDKDINVIMQNIKEQQFNKLNIDIYDYFWHENIIFVMCIYNKHIPIAVYLNSDVAYENSILIKIDEITPDIKKDVIIHDLDNVDNVLEKYDRGIAIKVNNNIIHYRFINEVDTVSEIRHSIVPLFLFNNIVNSSSELENKFEPLLNIRLSKNTSNINSIKQHYESVYKSLFEFESLYFNNVKIIIEKIVSFKSKKKQLMDDYNYYTKNNIVVNNSNKSDFDMINNKLISYFAYYEKYLSYHIMLNKINNEITQIEEMLKELMDDMINH